VRFGLAVLLLVASLCSASAQQTLLDRILARVDSTLITLSDVRAAVGLGLVEPTPGQDPDRGALVPLIERQVLLAEVARFPAPEPTDTAIDELFEAMRARVGARLPALMQSTGLDEPRIRAMARDTLRMQAYVKQRFGAAATLTDAEVRQWLRDARTRANVTMAP
jgi:hypothetical protein